MFIRKSAAILAATLATTAFATQYEAESATVSSEAKIVHASGVSGTGYVSMQEGSITFTGVTAETAGKYTLTIRYKAGDFKANYLKVNGSTAGTIDFEATTGWTDLATAVTLKAGTNTIAIEKYWGWIDVDYIDISAYESVAFKLSDKPVTPNATAEAVKLYSFLKENFGKKTISGIMTGDMSSYSIGADAKTHEDAQIIYNKSGKYPALVGMDFLFASGPKASESWYMEYTEKGISLAKDLWKQGGIPAFTWHWKDPLDQKDAFYIQSAAGSNEYTDFDFATAFKSGTTEWNTESTAYKGIIDDIDHIADYFLELQDAGVAGIFRPLHEAGGLWFWWSINSGEQFAALYRLVYDRMVKVKGVRNMIWVYNPEPKAVTDWDPGKDYYDIISIDIYNSANDHSSNASAFEKYKNATGSTKIVALTENGPIPDVNNMHTDEAVWSWWMPWYGTWSGVWPSETSESVWKSNMADERVITLEDMPGWDKYTPSSSSAEDPGTTHLVKAPQFYGTATTVGIFDMNGHYTGKSLNSLPQGRYIVRQRVQGRTKSTLYIKK